MSFFTRETAIGVDIGDRSIEVARVEKNGPSYRVAQVARVELRAGIIDRAAVQDPGELARSVEKAFEIASVGKNAAEPLVFGLPENKTYIHTMQASARGVYDYKELVEKEVARTVPLDRFDTVFVYEVAKKDHDAHTVVIAAASKNVIDGWKSFFSKIGHGLSYIEPELFAIHRGIFGFRINDAPKLVLDFGARTATISVFVKNSVEYSHTLSVGGDRMTEALVGGLHLEIEAAERKKREHGFAKDNKKIFEIFSKLCAPLTQELNRVAHMKFGAAGAECEEIICVGGTSRLPHCVDFIAEESKVPARIGSSFLSDSIPKRIDMDADPLLYIEAIGLALGRWQPSELTFDITPRHHQFLKLFPWRR